ncbi:hypothetical protein FB565_007120 [Actinoplanes lutulentus]|uniref:LPXTG-motif cell wall-anchored protein n=1 Tax=Actinoplanes lutulentus TaxID=1287878 RepID=A0A327ZAD9_9ACTN|nr:hypothetical protein [Actinoplanes lutulentus]MBB2947352.1 hypothetical protein [Actinoplanes lutulentus]RAK36627.1 hypothetical protein B0I29_108217 [Actinoplanes lutulentus]
MTRSRRLAALTMLAAAVLAPFSAPAETTPAAAAPAGTEGSVYLRNLTLPTNGSAVEESLFVLMFADEPGWADSLTLTIDTTQVGVADVDVATQSEGKCSTGPVVRCVMPGPHRVFERPDDGTSGYMTFGLVSLRLTPQPTAAAGDSGTLSVATTIDDGPTSTETATIRIGEGVNLTAVDDKPRSVTPGGSLTLTPRVRNSGPTAVEGLTAVISTAPGVLAGTNFGNCTYGYAISCTFDTTLAAGATYQVAAPFTLRVPGDAAAASQTSMDVQWLTAAEWEDWQAEYSALPDGRPGTGAVLELDEVDVSAAGVPQADTDNDDNGSHTTVTVAGVRRTDVVAFGAAIPGSEGDHTLKVGLANEGPGTLRHPPFINNAPVVQVTLPAPMTVVTADERCFSVYEGDDQPAVFQCRLESMTLRPGQHLTFAFTVRNTEQVHNEEGSVQVALFEDDGAGVDRNPRNNHAAIKVTATGSKDELPITGPGATTIGGIGLALILAGATLVATPRRPQALTRRRNATQNPARADH